MNQKKIEEIVDKFLKLWIEIGQNTWDGAVEPEMSDPNQDKQEEFQTWFPIDSTLSDFDLEELESLIGYPLPTDYKEFLKYKHFYALVIGVEFCSHPIHTWKKALSEMIFESFTNEYLIEKGLIPFADFGGIGFLCFDTNINPGDNNYPVVKWDHEDGIELYSANFLELMIKLDKEASIDRYGS